METEPDSWLYSSFIFLSATPVFSIEVILGLLGIVFLLIASALMSGSEVAYFSLAPADLEKIEEENGPSDKRILKLKSHPGLLLATILVGNNFVNIGIVLISDFVLKRILSEETMGMWSSSFINIFGLDHIFSEISLSSFISFMITVVGVTFLLVLFGEVSPKVYARSNNIKLARLMSAPLLFLIRVFRPLTSLLITLTGFVERRLAKNATPNSIASREEIDEAITLTVIGQDIAGKQEIDILKSIVKFGDVMVKQIMRSRVDVVSLDFNSDYEKVIAVAQESGYSRIPVYVEDFDHIKGILYVKDLLGHLNETSAFAWQNLVRSDVLYVPEAKRISDLLKDFQRKRLHMAIVVDEYGGSSGIVTLEDIMEEVIGDIKDEFDDEPEVIYKKIDDFNYTFEGKTLLNDLCRVIGVDTSTFDEVKGESDSLAGLILEIIAKLPEKDEEVLWSDFRFKIIACTPRRIEEVLVTLPSA
ncbi:MAG: gliding motility-associated protein GldE [Saprospiraceae bacterium]|nr:gliding motility-associated protein GldE [Saprospiraceae bacterium]